MYKYSGYLRKDGSIGIRNYVAVIPTVGCVNEVASRIATQVDGAVPILHHQGCCQLKPDVDTVTRVLEGIGKNPNVVGVLLVSLGCEAVDTKEIEKHLKMLKPTYSICLQKLGGITKTVERGINIVQSLVSNITNTTKEVNLNSLVVGLKCGASDATSGIASNPAVGVAVDKLIENGATVIFGETTEVLGAEEVLAKRAVTAEIASGILKKIEEMEHRAKSMGVDMRGSQPTPGNIRGGLTTIEEKSLGAIIKSGTKPINGVLEYGEQPSDCGLYFMDTPGREIEVLTGLASGGCQLILFTTGVGAPQGFPLCPVIKISGNKNTCLNLKEHIDIDVSTIISGEETIIQAGERIFREILEVASGKKVKAELLGYDKNGINIDIYTKGPVI
ncbi:UxaA family hydrolase [Candidatus Aerophobetes bacterium]|nr:UxaA family hydrolase [Candidatus Aerophobetes bacterium]